MDIKTVTRCHAAVCAAIGCGGALLFLFVFPIGSISTLMHDVLRLPGPGAGIALVLGPLVILVALISILVSRGSVGALIGCLAFGLTCVVLVWLFRIPTNPKGAFGSPLLIAAVGLAGLVVEASELTAGAVERPWRSILSGALANAVLLASYWIIIFPYTADRVRWADVPLLLGLAIGSGAVWGYIADAVSNPLSVALARREKE
ncbi:MAG: hypothetical protein JSV86_21625 [Gemmatimonadota bacterium]|nr:MAG: hypothetical protein JSV86_21625 [Gemmatimonadota bacterium]